MPLPTRLKRRDIDDNPTARIGRFAKADHQNITRDTEIFDRPGQCKAVRRDDTDIGFAINKAVWIKIFGINHTRIDVGENLKLIGDARIIAVGGQTVADASVPPLRLNKGLNHSLRGRRFANPFVTQNRHISSGLRTALSLEWRIGARGIGPPC